MAQKAKCASGWKVTIPASPQPSSSSDRSASDRLGSSSSSASASSTSVAHATVSARSSVECSFLEEARSVKTTSCRQNLYFLVSKNIFHGCLYAFSVCVRLEGEGGSTQTNIVRLKQNVDNWRRPLSCFAVFIDNALSKTAKPCALIRRTDALQMYFSLLALDLCSFLFFFHPTGNDSHHQRSGQGVFHLYLWFGRQDHLCQELPCSGRV